MPVPPTPENPNGWGFIEKRKVLPHYQLSPRIQIVIGDVIKVTQGPYYMKDDVRTTMGSMKGKWQVMGIFESLEEGDVELDIREVWAGGLLGGSSHIRISGEERPCKILPGVITNRPHKIKLATSKYKKQKQSRVKSEPIEKTDLSKLAEIIRNKTKEN